MKNLKLSFYTVITDCLSINNVSKRIIYSTKSNHIVELEDLYFNDIVEERIDKLPEDVVLNLTNSKILVNKDVNEYNELLVDNEGRKEDENSLYYVIQPSAYCQLGCHYCGQTHEKKQLENKTSDLIYERIKSFVKPSKKSLAITWYGAEALTGLNQIKYLSPKLQSLAKDNKLIYHSEMITNGLALKKKTAELLISKYDIRHFKITLDGLAETHDKRRFMKNGNGSFDLIVKNIREVCEINERFYLTIRCNIDKENSSEVHALIDLLASFKIQRKVLLEFVGVVDWGGNDASMNSLTNKEFSELHMELMLYSMERGFRFKNLIPSRRGAPCMAVKNNQEVFDTYGNIYPCYEYPFTQSHDKEENFIGNLHTNDRNNNTRLRNWEEDIKSDKIWCTKCVYLPVCGGACPKSWLEGNPPCPTFKYNMKERLVLNHYINK